MNENLFKTLEYYCEGELSSFEKNETIHQIKELIEKSDFSVEYGFGKTPGDKKSMDMYISISIVNSSREIIEIYDDGFLTASTKLISIDKKNRVQFCSWMNEEFMHDLNWILNHVKKISV